MTIIVTVFNAQDYLRRCLDSVVNQTFSNVEIIVVNDGSTDNSLGIIQEFLKNDSRIILFNLENQGPGGSRNVGIRAARGEFLLFIDSDDFVDLKLTEIAITEIKKHNSDLVVFEFRSFSPASKREWIFKLPFYEQTSNSLTKNAILGRIPYAAWTKIYRHEMIKKNKLFFPEDRIFSEDVIFSIKAIFYSKKTNFYRHPHPLYNYRITQGSLSNTFSKKHILDNLRTLEEISSFFNKEDDFKNVITYKSLIDCFNGASGLLKRIIFIEKDFLEKRGLFLFFKEQLSEMNIGDWKNIKWLKKNDRYFYFFASTFSSLSKKDIRWTSKRINYIFFKAYLIFNFDSALRSIAKVIIPPGSKLKNTLEFITKRRV